jgi:glycosyltransferase involved in cell wall biosynthesis
MPGAARALAGGGPFVGRRAHRQFCYNVLAFMLRILCISHALPYPLTVGGHQRTALILQTLSKFGQVDLILIARYGLLPEAVYEEGRRDHGLLEAVVPRTAGSYAPWKFVRAVSPKTVDRIAAAFGDQAIQYQPDPFVQRAVEKTLGQRKYDLIVSRHLYPAAMAGLLRGPAKIPVIVDADDVDYIVAEEESHPSAPRLKRLAFAIQRRQIRPATLPLFQAASHIWVPVVQDAVDFDPQRWSKLPNIPYPGNGSNGNRPQPLPPDRESSTLLVVASVGYGPNYEGIEYFLHQIWPAVRAQAPQASLRIVGSGMFPALREKWGANPGVKAIGFVDDLGDEYRRAAFCIVPVFRGGGTKVKAMECFSYGRTCVLSAHSHRGLDDVLKHGESLWRADDTEQFARGCVHLLQHPEDRETWAANGRRLVEANFNLDCFQATITGTLHKLGLIQGD